MVNFETLLFYIAVGVVVFSLSIIIMVFLFGLSVSQTLKTKKGIAGLLLLTISVSVTPLFIQSKVFYRVKAQSNGINSIELVPIDTELLLLSFNTQVPVLGYVVHKDKETVPYLPTYTLDMRNEHTVVIPTSVFTSGEVFIVAGTEEKKVEYDGNK